MSPKPADPRLRTALIEAAARLVAEEGRSALSTRRLAAEVGASTMAVYTHFDGMEELSGAVAKEGFDRLASELDAIDQTDDPVADVAAQGVAYFLNGLTNSHIYRLMFQAHREKIGESTFQRLVSGVARAVEAGRFEGDPEELATQLWAMAHGIVTLYLDGVLDLDEAIATFAAMGRSLFIGFGDAPDAADRAIQAARARYTVDGVPATERLNLGR